MTPPIVVRDITDREQWERFVISLHPNTFLHSWNWREAQEKIGERVMTIGAFSGSDLVGVALGIAVQARRGRILFCPHGPLTRSYAGPDVMRALLGELKRRAKGDGSVCLRVSPVMTPKEGEAFFRGEGFRSAPTHMHAERMWVLRLEPEEDRLLAEMRKTTRNLVRRAERDGVTVRFSTDADDINTFTDLYQETATREHFVPFSRPFLEAEFAAFVGKNQGFLAFAEHNGTPLASALVITHGGTGFYHQGASSRRHPKIPAPYLLQWRIIQKLKESGHTRYNFWGIAPENTPNHPWAGLTLFKEGFGGEVAEYLHAQDLPLRPGYWITYVVELLRKKKRGL